MVTQNGNGNGHAPLPDLPLHELAYAFPPMTTVAYEGLKLDIQQNGLIQPIAVWSGQIIDGRHRYQACKDLGLHKDAVPFNELADDADPASFVWSAI